MLPVRFRGTPAPLRLLASFLLVLALERSEAMSFPPSPGAIQLDGRLNTTCVPHNGGTVYLQIGLNTGPDGRASRARRPLNLAVVLDRSGSMADERKLEYAKQAVASLLDRLTGEDNLSIVVYDDQIVTLLPMQPVRHKERILAMLEEVYPRGATNLGGGMLEGFRQIEEHFRPERVNRVILLSDGLANRGIVDPARLDDLAAGYRGRGISLSTIGVGLEYNENLMLGLSQQGGGNYYFVESAGQLGSIFAHEMSGLNCVIAQNASIEITPGRGVEILDAIGCTRRRDGERWVMDIGDLYANDHREYTVALSIPEGSGTLCAARGILRCDGPRQERAPGFSVQIRYTDDAAELIRGKDAEVQGKADLSLSTRRVEEAMKALDEGRRDEAGQELDKAKTDLLNSAAHAGAAAAPLLQEQARLFDSFSQSVRDSSTDLRLVKKSMQYRNYRTQQQKK
jgi:Ca-activated chloride channel family protein